MTLLKITKLKWRDYPLIILNLKPTCIWQLIMSGNGCWEDTMGRVGMIVWVKSYLRGKSSKLMNEYLFRIILNIHILLFYLSKCNALNFRFSIELSAQVKSHL